MPAVAKIVGPGNAYVAAAKRQVRGRVEIDQRGGPERGRDPGRRDARTPGWVAADLLAQAEHGSGDETVVLVTPSATLAAEVARLVARGRAPRGQPRVRPRARCARHGAIVLVRDLERGRRGRQRAGARARRGDDARRRGAWRARVVAGAVFVGPCAPVAVGDYGIGPNHVLPTGGAARYASPLSVRDFQRRHSRVRADAARGLARVTEDMVRVALAEGFRGHAQSVLTRFEGMRP